MKKLLLYVGFIFTVGSGFDLSTFADSLYDSGIKLYARSDLDTVDGYLRFDGVNTLEVELYEVAKAMIPKTRPKDKNIVGLKVLPSVVADKETYRQTIQNAITANGG